MRRVLQALDDVRSESATAASLEAGMHPDGEGSRSQSRTIGRLFGSALSTKAVGFVLLASRIVLFVLCSASIVLMVEFPCEMYVVWGRVALVLGLALCGFERVLGAYSLKQATIVCRIMFMRPGTWLLLFSLPVPRNFMMLAHTEY
jgi:hypothetical protein